MSRGVVLHASEGEKSVLVPIGEGSEEMEAVIIIDVLRRAGAKVHTSEGLALVLIPGLPVDVKGTYMLMLTTPSCAGVQQM